MIEEITKRGPETLPQFSKPESEARSEISSPESIARIEQAADTFRQELDYDTIVTHAATELKLPEKQVQETAASFKLSERLGQLGKKLNAIVATALSRLSHKQAGAPAIATGELYQPKTKMKDAQSEHLSPAARFSKKREVARSVQYTREGMARMETAAINFIRQKPDASREEILEVIDKYATAYGLKNAEASTEYYDQIEQVVLAYLAKHRAVAEIRAKVKDDRDLYFTLFGAMPKGKVEILAGPMTLHVRCNNLEDYTRIYFQNFKSVQTPTEAQMTVANYSGGCSIATSLQPELAGCITAEKALGDAFDSKDLSVGKEVHLHEEQHAIKRLFESYWPTHPTRPNTWPEARELFSEGNVEAAKQKLMQYFRYNRGQDAEKRAADEILAYLLGTVGSAVNTYTPGKPLTYIKEDVGIIRIPYYNQHTIEQISEGIVDRLMAPASANGLYDYTAQTREFSLKALVKEFRLPEETARELISTAYREDYKRLIARGLSACIRLLDSGYSLQDTLPKFNHAPLHQWSKRARHTLKQKSVRHPNIGKVPTAKNTRA